MGRQILLLILSFISGFIGAIESVFSDEENRRKRRRKRIIGLVSLAVLATSLFFQGYFYYQEDENGRVLREHTANLFSNVPEASGGAIINGFAYLVDDNRAALYRAEFNGDKYNSETFKIDLYDLWPSTDVKKHILNKDDVDDLEGVARFGDMLYLITSHSDTKQEEFKERRQRFLEVKLIKDKDRDEIGLVTRWANLRKAIEQQLFPPTPGTAIAEQFMDRLEPDTAKGTRTVMEIEGLAIDGDGNVYLGFRGPQKIHTSKSLILRANLNQIFSPNVDWTPKKGEPAKDSFPQFSIFDVNIGGSITDPYGIVDMAFYNNSLLILTSGAYKNSTLEPELWQWPIGNIGKKAPDFCSNTFYKSPGKMPARPEVLLPSNEAAPTKVFMFLDAEGFGGGQRSYEKSQLRLAQ
jgi:hypothetical protein